MKKLAIILTLFLASNLWASVHMTEAEVKRILSLQKSVAQDPKMHTQVFSLLLKNESAKSYNAIVKSLPSLKKIPVGDLIGDTIYFKDKKIAYKFKLDFKNPNHFTVNGKDFNFDQKKSLQANFNALVSIMKNAKLSFNIFFEEAWAQVPDEEAYTLTVAISYFSSYIYYSQPDVYVPQSFEKLVRSRTAIIGENESRYCELNTTEIKKMGKFSLAADRNKHDGFFKWDSSEVFPGYAKELVHVEENFERINKAEYEGGIASYSDMLGEKNEQTKWKNTLFFNTYKEQMINSELNYMARILGQLNKKMIDTCRTNFAQDVTIVPTAECLDYQATHACLGQLIERRRDYLTSLYSYTYCDSQYLEMKGVKVFAGMTERCQTAAENQLLQRDFLCDGKSSEKLLVTEVEGKVQNSSRLIDGQLCASFNAPICFPQTNNEPGLVCTGEIAGKCLCVPDSEEYKEGAENYKTYSGGTKGNR